MRRALALVVACSVAMPVADARPIEVVDEDAAAESPGFWDDVLSPHRAQIIVLTRAASAYADQATSDGELGERRALLLRALHLAQRALELDPDAPMALAVMGRVADELGRTGEAKTALLRYVRREDPGALSSGAVTRLGAILLRQGDRDGGIRWLREAAQSAGATTRTMILLANALAARGEVGEATDVLKTALAERTGGTSIEEEVVPLVFALAMIYDRDEQRAAAFEMIDLLRTSQPAWIDILRADPAFARLAPASDELYVQALISELAGDRGDARTLWALYAASGDSPWRARALDHIVALDHQDSRRTP